MEIEEAEEAMRKGDCGESGSGDCGCEVGSDTETETERLVDEEEEVEEECILETGGTKLAVEAPEGRA